MSSDKVWWELPSPSLWELHSVDKTLAIAKTRVLLPKKLKKSAEEVCHFFLYCYERQMMWQRRNDGQNPPFSKNNALGTMSFCNNYRELDRGTCFFRAQMLDLWKHSQSGISQISWIEKVLWASVCYRIVNKIETFEALGGIPTVEEWPEFKKKLGNLPPPIFTSAHLNPGLQRYLQAMTSLKKTVSSLAAKLLRASKNKNLEECFRTIKNIPNVGNFFAWQVTCDLLESKCLQGCTDSDWTMLGPGAKEGITIIFGHVYDMSGLDLARELECIQDRVYKAMGLEFPKLDGKHLSLKVIEHSLCEFCKYSKLQKSLGRRNKPKSCRFRKPRSHMDEAKNCGCGNSEDVFFCDFCLTAYCTDCASLGSDSWWKCKRCQSFEAIEWEGGK